MARTAPSPPNQPPVEVVVRLAPAATAPDSDARRDVHAAASRLGVALQPMHPATSDPDLAAYLVADVDPDGVDGVLETLQRCDGVEGAYAKPRGEPPERTVGDAR